MFSERANAICILGILREYSDEQHILPMREIISKCNMLYGLKPDRRTVYSAIGLLCQLGYDISTYDENQIGYYLRGRILERSEVLLLSNAVYSFPFITKKQSGMLFDKLQKQLSVHQRKKYHHLSIVRQDKKTNNQQVFLNIEILDEAISEKKKVRFTYLEYGIDKKLHPRREKAYVVNPYRMIYTNEHYYLICNYCGYSNTSVYRIDLIHDIKKLDVHLDSVPEEINASRNAVYAFLGKPENITLCCDRLILGNVIDKFGIDIRINKKDEQSIFVDFSAPPNGIKFWALQYLPYVEVIEPKWLRDEIIESIKLNKYESN